MLVGHLAVGLVAKRVEPRISLGTYVLAAFFADLVAFVLLIAGVEHFDPVSGVELNRTIGRDIFYSHSLLMDAIWAGLFAAVYFLRRRYRPGAWLLFGVVVSHWVLDVISHRPDMPLAPGFAQVYGLGLWSSFPATLMVEGGFWLLALILYAHATQPIRRLGTYVFWTIGVVIITLVWYGNLHAGMDPNPIKAGIGGLILFGLLVAWAYLVDRQRPARA